MKTEGVGNIFKRKITRHLLTETRLARTPHAKQNKRVRRPRQGNSVRVLFAHSNEVF